jgi:hypothetical protein
MIFSYGDFFGEKEGELVSKEDFGLYNAFTPDYINPDLPPEFFAEFLNEVV